MANPKITVVLNVFKRSSVFEQQLEAILSQSIPPLEILVWENGEERVPDHLRSGLRIARANENLGVWARFAYALNANGDFICVFDDDTIPGQKWFENCIATLRTTDGLLGTRGVIFDSGESYTLNSDVGVHAPNESLRQVDIVGHSWFFRREHLSAFWSLYDQRHSNQLAGEDIHFSFALQKVLGLPTLVPPHPIASQDLWGSLPEFASSYGTDLAAISKGAAAMGKFETALRHYRKLGFRVLADHDQKPVTGVRRKLITTAISRFPDLAHKIAKFPLARRIWDQIR